MSRQSRFVFIALLGILISPAGADAPDCDSESARALAGGQAGQPESGVLETLTPACHERARSAWTEGLLAYCEPRAGFERALAGAEETGPCHDRLFRVDFELGRQLRALRLERHALSTPATAASGSQPESTDLRLRVLERELAELEGLARIRGLLPTEP